MDIKRSGSQPSGNPATVYAGGSAGGLKSTDGGATWRQAGQGLNGAVGVTALAIDPSNSTNIYADSTQGIFRRVDGAVTFSAFSIGLTNPSVSALLFDSVGSLHAATDGEESLTTSFFRTVRSSQRQDGRRLPVFLGSDSNRRDAAG